MNARTFGKKTGGGNGGGEIASRRAAFIADERARAERVAESDVFAAPPAAAVRAQLAQAVAEPQTAPPVVLQRSLTVAYVLWLTLGVVGAHRFYLARPLTGAILATLFTASAVMVAREHYPYFAGIAASVLWMVADGFLIERMHRKLTGGAFAK